MKDAPVRHALEQAAFLPFHALLRALPHGASRAFGASLGALAGTVDRRRRQISFDNLALALPELGPSARQRIVGDCFRHFGASFCDAISSLRFSPEELSARIERRGFDNFAAAAAAGKGTIVLGSHFGNWEIVSPTIAIDVGPMSIVGRRADNPHFERLVHRLRSRCGNRSLDKRGSVREMFRVLEANGRLALLIDQRVAVKEGIEVPFFAHPALTSPIVARLSQRTGAPVIPVFGEELAGGRYRVEALPPIAPRTGEDDVTLTRRYLEILEARVRERPHLWLWLHRRWKR